MKHSSRFLLVKSLMSGLLSEISETLASFLQEKRFCAMKRRSWSERRFTN